MFALKRFMRVNDSRQNRFMRSRYCTQTWCALRVEKHHGSLTPARSNG